MTSSTARPSRSERLRRLLRPPRRLRVLRTGGFLIAGTLALGFATLNTGNNLLYLLMGALLGAIALSGWLSEQTLRHVHVLRITPMAVSAGEPVRIEYELTSIGARMPAHGLEVREIMSARAAMDSRAAADLPEPRPQIIPAWVSVLAPRTHVRARAEFIASRRGVYPLDGVTLATSFPFGLFRKERDIDCAGSITVWPRTDRRVRAPAPAGRRGLRPREGERASALSGRGDYRGLRPYRAGDDPRDIHWRSTARRGELILREYEHDSSDEYWIVLDIVAADAAAGEAAVETAASLIEAAARRGDRCGLAAGSQRIEPGVAAGRTEALLDVLAAVRLERAGPAAVPPAAAGMCLLVTTRTASAQEWGDVFVVSRES